MKVFIFGFGGVVFGAAFLVDMLRVTSKLLSHTIPSVMDTVLFCSLGGAAALCLILFGVFYKPDPDPDEEAMDMFMGGRHNFKKE